MTPEAIKRALDLHATWLRGEAGGEQAGLSGVVISGPILTEALLDWADLRGADLDGTSFDGADLDGAVIKVEDVNLLSHNQIRSLRAVEIDGRLYRLTPEETK